MLMCQRRPLLLPQRCLHQLCLQSLWTLSPGCVHVGEGCYCEGLVTVTGVRAAAAAAVALLETQAAVRSSCASLHQAGTLLPPRHH